MQSQAAVVAAPAPARASPLVECDVGSLVLSALKSDKRGDELQRLLSSFGNCFVRPLEQHVSKTT
jgi:hypothetical protein